MIIVKFNKFINESLGINKKLEEQSSKIFDYINSVENKDKNEFNIIYTNELGSFGFKLKISNLYKKAMGEFNFDNNGSNDIHYGSSTITLVDRKDKSTMLHELKHFDYLIRKRHCFSDMMFIANQIVKNKSKLINNSPYEISQEIFYVFDTNEFESKYHSYYLDIDRYISEKINMDDMSRYKNGRKSLIITLMAKCLESHDDKSYTWWVSNSEFKFSNYMKESDINRIFYTIGKKESNPSDMFGLFRETIVDTLSRVKVSLNIYTREEKNNIKKLRNKYEKEIKRRKKIFGKKFFRLFTIMVNKYNK